MFERTRAGALYMGQSLIDGRKWLPRRPFVQVHSAPMTTHPRLDAHYCHPCQESTQPASGTMCTWLSLAIDSLSTVRGLAVCLIIKKFFHGRTCHKIFSCCDGLKIVIAIKFENTKACPRFDSFFARGRFSVA